MINPTGFSAAAAVVLVLATAAPTAGLAEYKSNNGGNIRAGGNYRPPAAPYRNGPSVAGVPAAGAYRAAVPTVQPGGVYRNGYGGGYNGGYRGGYRDHDHDRDRHALVIIGGASPVYGYYYGAPAYYAPGYHGDGYDDGGPPVAPASVGDDTIAYCTQTYSSYDPRSGTYLGNDGYQYACP